MTIPFFYKMPQYHHHHHHHHHHQQQQQQKPQQRRVLHSLLPILLFYCCSLSILSHGSHAAFLPFTFKSHYVPTQSCSKLVATIDPYGIQFVGQGPEVTIRPGVVLIAPSYEYSHFLRHAAIFIYAIGTDEVYQDTVVRGVLIDQPTAFTMGEMSPGSVYGELAQKTLFTGGNKGKDSAILFHQLGSSSLDNNTRRDTNSLYTFASDGTLSIHNAKHVGSSGVYQGGIQACMDILDQGILDDPHVSFHYPDKEHLFKFFFNYIQFTLPELELLLKEDDPDTHSNSLVKDVWTVLQIQNPTFILRNDWGKGEAWAYLKNYIQTMDPHSIS